MPKIPLKALAPARSAPVRSPMHTRTTGLAAALSVLTLVACTLPQRAAAPAPAQASTSTGAGSALPAAGQPAPQQARAIAATAHPLASQAALDMLGRGGSAADAAVAAQMVLGLVEPQSSGVGGGALAMHWDATTRTLSSVDGLSAAPARTTAALDIDTDGSPLGADQVQRGGRSVGVPGALALLEWLHQRHGRLPWAQLFEPAIRLAEQGFAMPPYLHSLLTGPNAARDHAEFAALYFDAQGRVLPVGTRITHPAYARTMRALADLGPRGWLLAGAAREIVATAQRGAKPGLLAESDLMAYRAEQRDPVCAPRLRHTVCVMGPASFGGMAVMQTLGLLDRQVPGGAAPSWRFDDADFVHRFAEAARLGYADRLRYAADPGFAHVPVRQLISERYLDQRALAIRPGRAATQVAPGELPPAPSSRAPATPLQHPVQIASPAFEHADATSQIAIVDGSGNALSITTTINLNFGSRLMVRGDAGAIAGGIVLNNVLTNFSSAPKPGQVRPNQMAPFKRAVTSMTPTIVFNDAGDPIIVGGSAGGAQIVDYVAQSLVEMLANGRTPAEALAAGHVSAGGDIVQLERGKPIAELATPLQTMGHRVSVTELRSGLAFVRKGADGWQGAADPRRDGQALTAP